MLKLLGITSMTKRIIGRVVLIVGLAIIAAMPMRAELLYSGDSIALCGDSITEQMIYSVLIEDYLLMCQRLTNVVPHQLGWSGEATPAFLARIESDVLPFRPSVATTLYGMNDGGYNGSNPKNASAFYTNTVAFIKRLQDAGVRLVFVGSPSAVDSERFKTWRLAHCTPEAYKKTLTDLGGAAKQAAEDTGAKFVDVHAAMLAVMEKAKAKYGMDYPMTTDGVHPSHNGHLVIAYAFLKALGCRGDIGNITVNARTGAAVGSGGHRILSATPQKIEIESVRYPFCFVDDPTNKQSTRAILDCLPFNEDLNRYQLVVTNLATPRAVVKWGGIGKTFTAKELQIGINLASEFLDNPFSKTFAKVDASVKAKQAFEIPAAKIFLHSLPAWTVNHPGEVAVLKQLQSAVIEKSQDLVAAARSEFKPVRHVLEIVPLR